MDLQRFQATLDQETEKPAKKSKKGVNGGKQATGKGGEPKEQPAKQTKCSGKEPTKQPAKPKVVVLFKNMFLGFDPEVGVPTLYKEIAQAVYDKNEMLKI